MANRWDPWRLSNDVRFAERGRDDPTSHRRWDLNRRRSAAEVHDTSVHEAWSCADAADCAVLSGLRTAVDDLLDPMANLGSAGTATTLRGRAQLDILDLRGAW